MSTTITIGTGNAVIIPNGATFLEQRQAEKRAQRNCLLAESDWVVIKARENNEEVPEEWKTYRTSLRDMDFSNPDDIVFPEVPTS